MKIIAFLDHEIGYRLLRRMLTPPLLERLQLVAIVTTPENGARWWPGVAPLAYEYRIPLFRYPVQPTEINSLGPVDLFLLLSWPHILMPELLAVPADGTINLHYSLLPKYRGVYPVNWAIIRGENESGVTYHQVGSIIDHGPIICQGSIPILPEDTARSLQLRLDNLADSLFERMLGLAATPIIASPTASGSYFTRCDFEASNEINLQKNYTGQELINLLRGKSFAPYGRNAYFIDNATGRKIYLNLEMQIGDHSPRSGTEHV